MYNAANYIRRFVSVWVKCLANVVLIGGKNSSQVNRERYAVLKWGSYQAMKRMEHVQSNHQLAMKPRISQWSFDG